MGLPLTTSEGRSRVSGASITDAKSLFAPGVRWIGNYSPALSDLHRGRKTRLFHCHFLEGLPRNAPFSHSRITSVAVLAIDGWASIGQWSARRRRPSHSISKGPSGTSPTSTRPICPPAVDLAPALGGPTIVVVGSPGRGGRQNNLRRRNRRAFLDARAAL